MKFEKLFIIGICLVLALALFTGCGNGEEDVEENGEAVEANGEDEEKETEEIGGEDAEFYMEAGHVLDTGHPYHKGLVRFGELMNEKSDGQIALEIFPNQQLGGERDMIEGLQMGALDVTLVSTAPLEGFSEDFLVFDLPYIFQDRDTTYEVLDGSIGQGVLDELEGSGLVGLTFMENGFYHISSNEPIVEPEDIEGVTIRSLENQLQLDAYEAVGANPTPMAFPEVFTALQQGTLDATAQTPAVIYSQNFYEVQDYLADTWHFYAPAPLLISEQTFEELPEDLQEVAREAAEEATHYQRQLIIDEEERELEILEEEHGMTINEVDRELWQEKMIEPVYEEYSPDPIDPELIEEIQAAH